MTPRHTVLPPVEGLQRHALLSPLILGAAIDFLPPLPPLPHLRQWKDGLEGVQRLLECGGDDPIVSLQRAARADIMAQGGKDGRWAGKL